MNLFSGILYNLRGMWLGVRTPKLLFLGLARFFIIVILTVAATSLVLMIFGWFTPFGPVITLFSTGAAVVFLAWDNTDLVPARRYQPFRKRFRFLVKNLGFHLGFGLLFIIPVLNIFSLSFAPVGGTLYHVEMNGRR